MATQYTHLPETDFSHDLHRDLHRGNPHNVLLDAKHLHVICAVSNPFRYSSRYDIYKDFERHVLDSGAQLWTIEQQLRDRPFVMTSATNPYHIQVRSDHVLWNKENLWNIAVSRLPNDADYIMVADADIQFVRPDWAKETIHMLQHYPVIQPWRESIDLGPNYETRERQTSFCFDYLQDMSPYPKGATADMPMGPAARRPGHHPHHHKHHHHHHEPEPYYYYGALPGRPYAYHPGYCWAWRRDAIDKVGGFIDKAILGSADHHMALGLIGEAERSIHSKASKEYFDMVLEWQHRAEALNKNIGFMNGTITHRWHGKKKNRKYRQRWEILLEHEFNPLKDIRYEANGVLALMPEKWKLKHDLDAYFYQRNEDDIDTE